MSRWPTVTDGVKKILGHFKKPTTVNLIAHHFDITPTGLRSSVNRLVKKELLAVERTERVHGGCVTYYYKITAKGKELLRQSASEQALQAKPTVTAYARLKHSEFEGGPQADDARNVMSRPKYVPPKDDPVRPGAYDYRKIASKGIRA